MTRRPEACMAVVATLVTGQFVSAQDPPGLPPPPMRITLPTMRPPSVPDATGGASILSIAPDGILDIVGPRDVPPGPDRAVGWVRSDAGRMSPGKRGTLVLDDGQRLVGELVVDGDRAAWQPDRVAQRPIDPGSTRFIVVDGDDPPAAVLEDVVHLRNGDRANGIVQSIDGRGVAVESDAGGRRTVATVPWEAVRAVAFVSTPRTRAGSRAWLDDGSVLDARSIDWVSASDASFAGLDGPDLRKLRVERAAIAAVELVPGSVRALASMLGEASIPEGEDGVRYAVAAPSVGRGTWAFDAPPVTIEGPVRVACASPGAPGRLLATVHRSAAAARAGSLVLVVRSGGSEALSHRMGPGETTFELRADLAAAPFELVMRSDDGSLAGDCVELRRAVVVTAGAQP